MRDETLELNSSTKFTKRKFKKSRKFFKDNDISIYN